MQFWYRVLWETILRNYFEYGPVVQEMSFYYFLSGALEAPLFGGAELFVQFW